MGPAMGPAMRPWVMMAGGLNSPEDDIRWASSGRLDLSYGSITRRTGLLSEHARSLRAQLSIMQRAAHAISSHGGLSCRSSSILFRLPMIQPGITNKAAQSKAEQPKATPSNPKHSGTVLPSPPVTCFLHSGRRGPASGPVLPPHRLGASSIHVRVVYITIMHFFSFSSPSSSLARLLP